MQRRTFLSWFVLTLAVSAGAFFAWKAGVPQTIYANDRSMMTSVIAVLLAGGIAHLGWQSWLADSSGNANSDFGHVAEKLAVMAGFVGTAIGLSLQAQSLAGGATSFTALATSLFTTASGGTAAAILVILTYSLEAGIRRART